MRIITRRKRNSAVSRRLTVNASSIADRDWYILYPEIKLSGPWLERLGFEPGQKINITAAKNEVVIRLAK